MEVFVNFYQTVLAAPVGVSDTTITVVDAPSPTPGGSFRILLANELCLCTGISGTTLTITRAVEGTTAASYVSGTPVKATLTAAALNNLHTTPREVFLTLCAGRTPTATGADVAEFIIPYDPNDGTTAIVWAVRRIDVRVGIAGGAPSVKVESYSGTGAFTPSAVGTVTLASGANEGATFPSTISVSSGDKVRLNFLVLATAQNWTVLLTLGQS